MTRRHEIAHCIARAPAGAMLNELIKVAGKRWAIEECFQSPTQECGLDDYEVRRMTADTGTSPPHTS
ncbi:hypothetical protein J7E88_09870 [Streptomyces sp. ISL-10]|nr:hypothetical protein [Streptomyces sp. ISL-10]